MFLVLINEASRILLLDNPRICLHLNFNSSLKRRDKGITYTIKYTYTREQENYTSVGKIRTYVDLKSLKKCGFGDYNNVDNTQKL